MKYLLRTGSLVATSALLLAGCGSGSSEGGNDDGLVGEGTGAECSIDSPVNIGAVLSLTGGAGSYGENQQKGLELAVKQMNEDNEGIEYKLNIDDDASDPRQSMSVMEGFVDSDNSIVIGPTLSNTGFQAQPIAQDGELPVLAISNTADGITAQGDYIFRDSLTEAAVIPQTIEASIDKYDLKKVVEMYSNDDEFTKSGYEVMNETLEDSDVEIADTITFATGDTDFRSLLTKALDQDPDALVVSALIEEAIPFVTQARELGFDGPIIGGNGFNNPQLMADAGDDAEGVVVGAAWNSASESEENDAFMSAYEDEYDSQPDQFAAQAYAGIEIIDEAIRSECDATRAGIQEGLNNINDLPTVLGEISIDENRDADHEAVVQIVHDGKFDVMN